MIDTMLPCRNTSILLFIIIIIIIIIIITIIIIIIIIVMKHCMWKGSVYMCIGSWRHKNSKATMRKGQKGVLHCVALKHSCNATKRWVRSSPDWQKCV